MRTQVEVEQQLSELEAINALPFQLSPNAQSFLDDNIAVLKWVLS